MPEPSPPEAATAPGAFAIGAPELSRAGLVAIPCDGKRPLISFGAIRRPLGRDAIARFAAKFPAANVGIACGPSGVTIVDIDDPGMVATMIARVGESPLRVRTPSGGTHLWFRGSGERSVNRLEGLPVDVKATGGFAVVPPSIGKGARRYDWIAGSLADVRCLPCVKPGALPLARQSQPRRIHEGERNTQMFARLCRAAQRAASLEELIEIARDLNENDCFPPLPAAEAVKAAQSAWSYRRGERKPGAGEPAAMLSRSEIEALAPTPEALTLFAKLKCEHGAHDGPFAISARAMADFGALPGWSAGRIIRARDCLLRLGCIVEIHRGGRGKGDPSLFAFSALRIRW